MKGDDVELISKIRSLLAVSQKEEFSAWRRLFERLSQQDVTAKQIEMIAPWIADHTKTWDLRPQFSLDGGGPKDKALIAACYPSLSSRGYAFNPYRLAHGPEYEEQLGASPSIVRTRHFLQWGHFDRSYNHVKMFELKPGEQHILYVSPVEIFGSYPHQCLHTFSNLTPFEDVFSTEVRVRTSLWDTPTDQSCSIALFSIFKNGHPAFQEQKRVDAWNWKYNCARWPSVPWEALHTCDVHEIWELAVLYFSEWGQMESKAWRRRWMKRIPRHLLLFFEELSQQARRVQLESEMELPF